MDTDPGAYPHPQPQPQPPHPPQHLPQPYPMVVYPPPPPRPVVSKTSLSTGAHMVHLALTICTMGLWAPVWILHAIFAQRRTTTM